MRNMPSRDYLQDDVTTCSISAESLVDNIRTSDEFLLIDCRPQADYVKSHIRGAVNLTLPASIIMLRRLANGKLCLSSLVKDNDHRTKFMKSWKESTLVLYDTNSGWVNHSSSTVISTILRRLLAEKCDVVCLQGGFNQFKALYPEWCESEDLELPLKGLETLRINCSTPDEDDPDLCDSGVDHQGDGERKTFGTSPFPIEIIPNLFLGNATNSSDLEALESHGIQYVLNVTQNLPNVFERKGLGIKYLQIPIQDHWSQNLSSFFPQAIEFIDEARRKKLGVLVHCLAGISRSVTITLAYLMHELSMPLNDAYDFVRHRKANIAPNFNFLGQLKDFERQLNLGSCNCTCLQSPCKCQTYCFTSPTRKTPDSGVTLDSWT